MENKQAPPEERALTFEDCCARLEAQILQVGGLTRSLHGHPDLMAQPDKHNEAHINLELAYRHAEDASSRLRMAAEAYEAAVAPSNTAPE